MGILFSNPSSVNKEYSYACDWFDFMCDSTDLRQKKTFYAQQKRIQKRHGGSTQRKRYTRK